LPSQLLYNLLPLDCPRAQGDIQCRFDGAEVPSARKRSARKRGEQGRARAHAGASRPKVSRSFTLPHEIAEAKAEAKFRDGVLELRLPKKSRGGAAKAGHDPVIFL